MYHSSLVCKILRNLCILATRSLYIADYVITYILNFYKCVNSINYDLILLTFKNTGHQYAKNCKEKKAKITTILKSERKEPFVAQTNKIKLANRIFADNIKTN